MLSESLNDDFWMASGMMERNDARASAPDPPIVYYSVTDESAVIRQQPQPLGVATEGKTPFGMWLDSERQVEREDIHGPVCQDQRR